MKKKKSKKGFFLCESFLMPELNRAECLLMSWLIAKVRVAEQKRKEQRSMLPKGQLEPQMIDKYFVLFSEARIKKTFTFFSKMTLKRAVYKLEELNFITTTTHENRRYAKVNVKKLSNISGGLPDNRNSVVDWCENHFEKRRSPYFKIYEKSIHHFENADEVIMYWWVMNRLREKTEVLCGREMLKKFLGMGYDKQNTTIKRLQAKGMIQRQLKQVSTGKLVYNTRYLAIPAKKSK